MRRLLQASVAPLLLLVTPFAVFVQHQGYGFARGEVLLGVAAMAVLAVFLGAGAARSRAIEVIVLAALLTLFADVQLEEPGEKKLLAGFVALAAILWLLREHAARIVSVAMATILVVSLLPRGSAAGTAGASPPSARGRSELPLVLHVVLDEHAGIEGLPPRLAPGGFVRDVETFFTARGFRVFGRAYSEHSDTLSSLSHLLNLAPDRHDPSFATPMTTTGGFRLKRSAYFDRLAGRGYAIRVYQPEYLDMCAGSVRVSACYTYPANSLRSLDGLAAPAAQKLAVVAGAYVSRSELYGRAKRTYRHARFRLRRAGVPLPAWAWERGLLAPLGSMPVFERVAHDLSRAARGDMIFVHLLMPHYPYVFGAGCEPRPPGEWLTRGDPWAAPPQRGAVNTAESRAARYRVYFAQVLCTRRALSRVLDAIPPPLAADAVVIVQGDHGSRISQTDPVAAAAKRFDASDYADHFSTLFAVRAPGIAPGADPRPAPITCLLRSLVSSDFTSLADVENCSARRAVYFSDGTAAVRRPLVEFWQPDPADPLDRPRAVPP